MLALCALPSQRARWIPLLCFLPESVAQSDGSCQSSKPLHLLIGLPLLLAMVSKTGTKGKACRFA